MQTPTLQRWAGSSLRRFAGCSRQLRCFPLATPVPIWNSETRDPSGLEDGPLGYKAGVTNQLPKNLGAGTNLHAAVLGDWSQCIVADGALRS